MNELPFIALLKRALPTQSLPWVTASLRQDGLVWRCLQDGDFRARALARTQPGIDQAEAWSPAALVLLALDLPYTPQRLSSDIHYPLESRLRRKVAAAARFWTMAEPAAGLGLPGREAGKGGLYSDLENLEQAGLLALALRERRRLVGSWEGLLQDLNRMRLKMGLPFSFWSTPLACLYGMVPDPQDLLEALLPPGAGEDNHILALHVILANPMPPEEIAKILHSLLKRGLAADGVTLLNRLAKVHPALATEMAGFALDGLWQLEQGAGLQSGTPEGPFQSHSLDALANLAVVSRQLQIAQAHRFADRPAQALPLLQTAKESCIHLHAELTAEIALSAREQDPATALAAWEQSVSLAPENPVYRAGLIISLLEAGRADEARQWLGVEDLGSIPEQQHISLVYTAALLATAAGEFQQARQIAGVMLDRIKAQSSVAGSSQFPPVDFQIIPPSAFPKLCMELGMMEEAAWAAQQALSVQPVDIELLALEGQAWLAVGQSWAAVHAFQIAVALAPDRPGLHRQLASALEASGDWQAALEQREIVVNRFSDPQAGEAVNASPDPELGADLRALAICALHAGFPKKAIEACHSALALDEEDGLAHLFLGQALVATGDVPSAQEHYLRATRLAPSLAQAWLSLAQLQQGTGQPARAMETLRSAAQALPDSADIYLALGEACLGEDPAPTQALGYFQRAAALAPDSMPVRLRLGQTLHTLGHLLEARHILESAYQDEPTFPGLAHACALVLVALGEMDSALPVLSSLVADPAFIQAIRAGDEAAADAVAIYLAYGQAILATGKVGVPEISRAVQAFQRVLELDPGCAEAQACLAESLAASGDLPGALQAFQSALGAMSASGTDMAGNQAWQARLSLGLGRTALALGQNETAVAALQEAALADPHNPGIARSLAEACYIAGLPENALQAAHTALRLAPDDLETLSWFADQATTWIGQSSELPGAEALPEQEVAEAGAASWLYPEKSILTPSAITLLRTEALNALARAMQIDPKRADLLVRLGRIQLGSGDRKAALDTFREIATTPHASCNDLYTAARSLLGLGDAAGAVTCLETATSLASGGITANTLSATPASGPAYEQRNPDSTSPGIPLLDLQILLASAYEKANNISAALATLDAALAEAPHNLSLYMAKARMLTGLGRRAEALASLETAIQLAAASGVNLASPGAGTNPGSSQAAAVRDLHYQAALLLRSAGDLPGALSHTNLLLASYDPASPDVSLLPAQVLAAELAHSMLLPERARSILNTREERQAQAPKANSHPTTPIRNTEHASDLFAYFCLRAELALDWEEEVLASESLARANEALAEAVQVDGGAHTSRKALAGEITPASPTYEIFQARLLAIQARLNILHGDRDTALEMVHDAVAAALVSSGVRQGLPLAGLVSIGEAAFLLGEWKMAIQCLQAAVDMAPEEPVSHVSLARILVLRAETERLYQAVGAIQHAPGAESLEQAAFAAFESSINSAHRQIGQWLPRNSREGDGRGSETIGSVPQPDINGRFGPVSPRTSFGGGRTASYRQSDLIQAQTMVSRWRARGQAVFQPGPQSAQALSATLAIIPPNPDDVAAQIAALRLSSLQGEDPAQDKELAGGSHTRYSAGLASGHNPPAGPLVAFSQATTGATAVIAAQATRAYPHHPLILAQLALSLVSGSQEALTAAHEAASAADASPAQATVNLRPVCDALLARLAWASGEQQTAWQAIGQALDWWPEEPRWRSLAAEIAQASGDLKAAAGHLEEAVRLEAGHLTHFLALGRVYFQQALQAGWHVPEGLPARNSQAAIRVKSTEVGQEALPQEHLMHQAVHTLEEACRLAPGLSEPWLALAEVQRAGGFLDQAAESAKRAIDLAPGETQPRILSAEIAMLSGDSQAAYEHILSAMPLVADIHSPTGLKLSLLQARTLDRLERPLEALGVLDKALPRASQPLPLLLERIPLLRKIHGAKAGSDALQQLANQYPAEPQILGPLAFALAEAGQEEAAIRTAQAALQVMERSSQPNSSPADRLDLSGDAASPDRLHALLGRLLRTAGQLDGAIYHLNEAIRLDPHSLDPYLELGRALQERRQHAQALKIYSQATHVAPHDPRPYYQAGLALKESKDYMGAENMLRRASTLAPNDLNIHRQLGAVVALNLVHNRAEVRQNA